MLGSNTQSRNNGSGLIEYNSYGAMPSQHKLSRAYDVYNQNMKT